MGVPRDAVRQLRSSTGPQGVGGIRGLGSWAHGFGGRGADDLIHKDRGSDSGRSRAQGIHELFGPYTRTNQQTQIYDPPKNDMHVWCLDLGSSILTFACDSSIPCLVATCERGAVGWWRRCIERKVTMSGQSSQVCRDFQNGYCRYGDKCRFVHPKPGGGSRGTKYQFK